ncbi:hypothetical protein VO178_02445 [Lysinibacillus fusiformis]|uniref:hypothetical protein n=1 Tax=Lysinibacillus fusiformis TaxID=28031 RepID=UPI002D76B347|nr:hypothetical protein [Lysinibacillus fusiformis]WRS98594.1 hypothetical protein VO178_02445 [Lysinibacillus fusiformis]
MKIITLCGSTKFKEDFELINRNLTLEGNIVLSVGVFEHSNKESITTEQKAKLDDLHKKKIDLSDEIYVINVGGYIGESTASEIEYAKKMKKGIKYLVETID